MREKLDELARRQEVARSEQTTLAICAYRRALMREGDALLEYVRQLEGELARLRAASPLVALAEASLAARDAHMKRLGAAEWLEQNNERLDHMNNWDIEQEAKRLREGK